MTVAVFLSIFLTAALPVAELRGAIPLGILEHNVSWPLVFLIAFAGNLLPVPFLLLFLDPVSRILSRVGILRTLINWIFEVSRRRGGLVEKYGTLGLIIFVAIPLPITGAWTGSIIAFLLGLKFWRALPAIMLGVFIAGIIVTSLTTIGWWGAAIAGAGLLIAALFGLRRTWYYSGHRANSPPDSQ
ncbi:MAG: small multi-drug export protein [Dehalococcoidia bacterium]|nr:small multi-drug export protein [Dehalococcoidia bacterium]